MAESFAARWERKSHECGLGGAAAVMVARGADVLPADCAPCLTFAEAARPAPLWEVFGSPRDWPPAARDRLARFRMIGSDGAGNPICVDQETDTVVLLDHEAGFRTVQFLNGSVRQLAECLLAYLGERDARRFLETVSAIDPAAVAEGAFWRHEAAGLSGE